jgi:23S rRNA pseudouridine1911/1915/1917 synthase
MPEEPAFICDEENIRLDAYLSGKLPDVSRTYLQKLIKDGMVMVNGQPAKQNYRTRENDLVQIFMPHVRASDAAPQDMPLNIIYEDEHIIVVNKEKGMVVHPAPGNRDRTLVNALLHHCKGNLSDISGIERPGIVHRIDKDTSGIIVAAKTNVAHRRLSEMMAVHDIKREYIALVKGVIHENQGRIDAPIGRHPKDRIKMAVNTANGKNAVTHFKVLERYRDATYVEVTLETGRTHQIRVHMAYINHPVIGDTVYGGKKKYNIEGQALHARLLGFVHPATGLYMEFKTDVPSYMEELKKELADE